MSTTRNLCSQDLNNLMTLPAGRFGEGKILAWMRLLRVPVLAHEGVGVFVLIEIAESVVDFAMLAFVCPNLYILARKVSGTC